MRTLALFLLLTACAPVLQKATSPDDYCRSGPQDLAQRVSRFTVDEETAIKVVLRWHADIIQDHPAERPVMEQVVRLVYAHPGIRADAAGKLAYEQCMTSKRAEVK